MGRTATRHRGVKASLPQADPPKTKRAGLRTVQASMPAINVQHEVLAQDMLAVQGRTVAAVGDESDAASERAREELVEAFSRLFRMFEQGLMHSTLVQLASAVAANIFAVTSVAAKMELKASEARAVGLQAIEHVLSRDTGVLGGSRATAVEEPRSLSYESWRAWFLTHLDHPYPDITDKEQLLEDIGGQLGTVQLNTWFTNARRRSGWTELYKNAGKSDAATMRKILAADISPDDGGFEQEVFDSLGEVIRYFEQGGRDRVSSWVDEVVKVGQAGSKKQVLAAPQQYLSPAPGQGRIEEMDEEMEVA